MNEEDALQEQVEALALLDLFQLREAWPARLGPLPRMRAPEVLRRQLAWRLQAYALGGLDAQTAAALAEPPSGRRSGLPSVGSRLAREWQGERHEVEILQDGVIHRGVRYASLSQAARAITGVRWNGPRFFGLRDSA